MKKLQFPLKDSDIDTRGKRRRVCSLISDELWRIHEAEEAYISRMPENIAAGRRYLYARRATDDLLDAMIALAEAYEPF